jgi:hypothetical protein
MSETLAILIGDDSSAVGAGLVPGKQLRQAAERDMSRGDADEIFFNHDRLTQSNDRVTGVGFMNGSQATSAMLWRANRYCGTNVRTS